MIYWNESMKRLLTWRESCTQLSHVEAFRKILEEDRDGHLARLELALDMPSAIESYEGMLCQTVRKREELLETIRVAYEGLTSDEQEIAMIWKLANA